MAKAELGKFHSTARLLAGLVNELVDEHDHEVQALVAENEKLFLAASAKEAWALESPVADGTSAIPMCRDGSKDSEVVRSWSFNKENWNFGLERIGTVKTSKESSAQRSHARAATSPCRAQRRATVTFPQPIEQVLPNVPLTLPSPMRSESHEQARNLPYTPEIVERAMEPVRSWDPLPLNEPSSPLSNGVSPRARIRRTSRGSLSDESNSGSSPNAKSTRRSPLAQAVSNLKERPGLRFRHRQRFQRIFNLDPDNPDEVLDAVSLQQVLETRAIDEATMLEPEALTEVLLELRELGKSISRAAGKPKTRSSRTETPRRPSLFSMVPTTSSREARTVDFGTIEFEIFVELMQIDQLPSLVTAEISETVWIIQYLLMAQDINDVLVKAGIQSPDQTSAKAFSWPSLGSLLSRLSTEKSSPSLSRSLSRSGANWLKRKARGGRTRILLPTLNMVVSLAVISSILGLGVSMDNNPDGIGWIFLECACALVFLAEFVIKLYIAGWRNYFCGPAMLWNWSDMFLTGLALVDTTVSFISSISIGRLGLSLRSLRLFRLARLLKMVNSPILKDLSNMLSGLVVGAPALFWVCVMLGIVTYIIALGFRVTTAPNSGTSLIEICGYSGDHYWTNCGDSIENATLPECNGKCRPHYLYGEEFFGTMPKSLFTVFRCMTWDCETKMGQSLTVHFSQGFGWRFDVMYFAAVIFLSFGLFNVITAVFVETTSSGLKHNAMMKKFTAKYEADYTRQKMHKLLRRIFLILGENPLAHVDRIRVSEEKFYDLLKDEKIVAAFEDLNIHGLSRHGRIFDLFDPDGRGEVALPHLISTLFLMRGEVHKTDVVSNWVALRGMNTKIISMQSMLNTLEGKVHSANHSSHSSVPPGSGPPVLLCDMPEVPTMDEVEEAGEEEPACKNYIHAITSASLW